MLFKICMYSFFVHLLLKKYNSDYYNRLFINISYYLILLFSYTQIQTKKIISKIKNTQAYDCLIKKIEEINYVGDIEVIGFSKLLFTTTKELIYEKMPCFNSFIIYSHEDKKTKKVNKIIVHSFSNETDKKCFDYIPCNYSFISINISISNNYEIKDYTLKFSSEFENYFIINNKFNKNIIFYLLYKQFNVCYDENISKYEIQIIDQNASLVKMNENDELILKLNDYEIISVIENESISQNYYSDELSDE